MKRRYKTYLKINLILIFFITISLISATLAWFAYSGLSRVSTNVKVKAWYIELEKNGNKISNDITITADEIYPGMNTVTETIKIKNLGDSDADVKYKVVSARLLNENEYQAGTNYTSEYIEDLLAHNFPFSVDINIDRSYALAKGGETIFNVSISWPLDSDQDTLDSEWGNKAYNFQIDEEYKKVLDENYQIKPSIQIEISVTAEQYLENEDSSDFNYNMGDEILFDVVANNRCQTISPTCIMSYVVDVNSKLDDNEISLLLNPYGSYVSTTFNRYEEFLQTLTSEWNVRTRPLLVNDILKIISTDIFSSVLVRENLSDSIIGGLLTENRLNFELTKAISYNGYYKFLNEKFPNLGTYDCYWTNSEYNGSRGFAVKKIDESTSKLYGNPKTEICKIIPVIVINKDVLHS